MENGKVITLENGLRVVCLQKPNFKTTSIRIKVFAGSMHQDVPASAHFFEHICFQGTTEFPTQKKLNAYADSHAIYKNAYTNQTETQFSVDGLELDSVVRVAAQIAFHPLLTEESVEKERGAVIDEARASQFAPGMKARQRQWVELAGEEFGKLVTGTIDEIAEVSHKDLIAFHTKHYRPGNTFITICSDESIEKQLEAIKLYTKDVQKKDKQTPTKLELPWLESKKKLSLEQNELDQNSQTHITLNYKLSSPKDYRQYLLEVTATNVISYKAHEHLRQDLVLAYDAGCTVSYLNNRNFGIIEDFQSLTIYSSVSGDLAERCIKELKLVPDMAYKDTTLIKNKINNIRYSGALDAEANVIDSANAIARSAQIEFYGKYSSSKFVDMVQSFSVEEVQAEIKKITKTLKQIQVTGPNKDVLKSLENITLSTE